MPEYKHVINSKGEKTVTKKIILNTGSLKHFDNGEADYIQRLRQSFCEGRPRITELQLNATTTEEGPKKQEYDIHFNEREKFCVGSPKRFTPCILYPVFSALGLDGLFASIKYASKIEYDLQGIVRLLIYDRILEPASKIFTATTMRSMP